MIEFRNVTKRFGGATALDWVSLNITGNGIYSLLGRNGAGKTTLLKLIAGYIHATEGEVIVDGKPVTPMNAPSCAQFIESNAAQFNMKVGRLLEAASDLQEGFDIAFAKRMLTRFQLNPHKRFNQLSFGMKTMVTTILSLSNNSKALLLDEPVLGFDAIMRSRFNALLYESYELHPRVIIVSTHLIDEIAKITQKLIIINDGRILLQADIDDIDEKAYSLTGPSTILAPALEGLNVIGREAIGGMLAAYIYDRRIKPPAGVMVDRLSLQDFFIKLVEGDEQHA
ncbi:MAG: ABC transporter ATP-binding protein [Oscillospiraceae bacterium]|jgi:ABC-2 type transport system ATP-binding protein|nr:ABC transporter ATP-binding protein [Oscillospiraceae bacterium]